MWGGRTRIDGLVTLHCPLHEGELDSRPNQFFPRPVKPIKQDATFSFAAVHLFFLSLPRTYITKYTNMTTSISDDAVLEFIFNPGMCPCTWMWAAAAATDYGL